MDGTDAQDALRIMSPVARRYLGDMPELVNHHDLDDAALRRAAQGDPWVMHIVVRKESGLPAESLLRAVVKALFGCAAAFERDPAYSDAFAAWYAQSFRKVALVADERQWARLQEELPCALAEDERGRPVVACLPPRLKSAQEPALKRLQTLKGELVGADPQEDALYQAVFVVNGALPLSLGKAVAQVGHAALMLARSPLADDERYAVRLERWRANPASRFLVADAVQWEALKRELDCVVVRDGGLTEVAAGSETVLACPPPDWGPLRGPLAGLKPLPEA